tara:strand:- start:1238 stop:1621 length:384 start_codon:yes stop_codon:yes gene_type:complete
MGLIIEVDEKTRITTDRFNWIVQKHVGKNWASKSYHPSYKAALRQMTEDQILNSKANDLQESIERVEDMIDQLVDMHKDLLVHPSDQKLADDRSSDNATIELEVIEKPKGEPLPEELERREQEKHAS